MPRNPFAKKYAGRGWSQPPTASSFAKAHGLIRWMETYWPLKWSPVARSTGGTLIRRRANIRSRWICWHIMRKTWAMTLEEIAAVFECDHTSIIHGLGAIRPEWVADAAKIEKEFMTVWVRGR